MQTFISLLRGLNVSGKNILSMQALKTCYESIDLCQVETYIQSGNVVFKSDREDTSLIAQEIEILLREQHQITTKVWVIPSEKWTSIIERNPLKDDAHTMPTLCYVTFTDQNLSLVNATVLSPMADEKIFFGEEELYLYYPQGYGKSKLNNNFIEKKLKLHATTRNWNTVLTLTKKANNLP